MARIISPNGGSGSNRTLSTAAAATEAAGKTIIVTGAETIAADTTIAATTRLEARKGALITINSGKTLTIRGPFSAGLYQCFTGSGSVVFKNGSVTEVYPEWWGAKPDGTTLSSSAISSAISSAEVAHTVRLSPGTYMLDTEIDISKKTKLIGSGGYSESGTATGTVLKKKSTLATFGLLILANATSLENFSMDGELGNATDGIGVFAGRVSIRNVSVVGQGRDGIRIGGASAGYNANLWRLDHVITVGNGRDGVHIESADNNANSGLATTLSSLSNGRAGLWVGMSGANTIVNPHLESNTQYGLWVDGASGGLNIIGGDIEANGTKNVHLDTPSVGYTHFIQVGVAQTDVTDLDPNSSWFGDERFQLPLSMPVVTINAAGGAEPAFKNSWENFGGGYHAAGYFKHGANVHLFGSIKSGGSGTSAFQLPAGFRPATSLQFPVVANGVYGFVEVQSTGFVVVYGSITQTALDGIIFKAEQ